MRPITRAMLPAALLALALMLMAPAPVGADTIDAVSPYGRTTTAALASGAEETVTTTINGKGAVWIQITPSQNPDGGTPHKLYLNDGTDAMEMDSAAPAYVWKVTIGRSIEHLPLTVDVESGKAGTTFLVEYSII